MGEIHGKILLEYKIISKHYCRTNCRGVLELIEEVKNRLIRVYKPVKIYLFGSHVWGQPTEDSDLDFLVIVEKSDQTQVERARMASDPLWDLMVSYELLVFTQEEFD